MKRNRNKYEEFRLVVVQHQLTTEEAKKKLIEFLLNMADKYSSKKDSRECLSNKGSDVML